MEPARDWRLSLAPRVAVVFCTAACAVGFTESACADDFDVVRERLHDEFLVAGTKADAQKALLTQLPQGGWTDIDYSDRSPGVWQPLAHLDRLLAIAQLCASAKAPSPDVCGKALNSGLGYWDERAPKSSNWWLNQIGQQTKLMPIILLGGDRISPDNRAFVISLLAGIHARSSSLNTGQNLVWFSTQQVVRGVLTRNAGDVQQASERLQAVMQPTSGEGWQVDYSFHQHGAQLYNNGYGLNSIHDVVSVGRWLAGTQWAFGSQTVERMAGNLLNGTRWMIWGPEWMDYAAMGREITRPHNDGARQSLIDSAQALAGWVRDPARAESLRALARSLAAGAGVGAPPYGVRAFWRSDFLVGRGPSSYASVRMSSLWTIGTESDNNENIRGYWLPFGVTRVLANGDEYEDPRLWDWAFLPGVTCGEEVPPFRGNLTQPTDFAGVLDDGVYGVAGMNLRAPGVSGYKAWFLVDGGLVALGSQLRSTLRTPLHTTLNQVRYGGSWEADGRSHREIGRHALGRTTAVTHRGLVYFSLQSQDLVADVSRRSGRRSDINKAVTDDSGSGEVFTLYVDHGQHPQDVTYAYAVMPAGNTLTSDWSSQSPWRVLGNRDDVQALVDHRTQALLAVLHRAGKLAWGQGRSLVLSGPALLALRADELGHTILTVADPTHAQDALWVEWQLDGHKRGKRRIALPRGDETGKPVSVVL